MLTSKTVPFRSGTNYETDGTKWVEPQYEKPKSVMTPGCKREFWYKARLSPIPSKWSYCFDDNGKLLDKYHWVSW